MITIAYITARPEPRIDWLMQSLALNNHLSEVGQIVIVDRFAEEGDGWTEDAARYAKVRVMDAAGRFAPITQHVAPKPCVWSGKHRLTPRNHWSASSYRNTALCYAKGDFIAYLDDRCVLANTWLDAVHEAREQNYCVLGTYEKRSGMVVTNGRITFDGKITATDSRMADPESQANPHRRRPLPGDCLFGCTFGLPTEWMLRVNGFDESFDSVSFEDCHFGQMLQNNGFPIYHDGRMKMIEDRTPVEQDPNCREHDMKRSSKEKHPHDTNDKTHTLKRKLWGNKKAAHQWDFRKIRDRILVGGQFPIPTEPRVDFFDNQPLSEMT